MELVSSISNLYAVTDLPCALRNDLVAVYLKVGHRQIPLLSHEILEGPVKTS